MPAIIRTRGTAALPVLLVQMLALVLVASVFAFAPPASAATRAQRIGHALHVVRAQVGDPYVYGAAGPNAFDCSGLVYYSYRRAGIRQIPRTSDALARHSRRISRASMRKGDLVFFHSGGNVYHVAVYMGRFNGHRRIIHASRTGTPVKRDPIWTNSWFPGRLG